MKALEGKKAIVTGSTSGIGTAIAELFAKEGAEVAVVGRSEAKGRDVVSRITGGGGRAFFVKADVSNSAEVESMASACVQKLGSVDIMVNNAGVQSLGKVVDATEEEWDRVFGTNAKGTFLCSRSIIPTMLKKGGGAIINIASVGGLRSFAGGAIYCSSKFAVVGFTKALALEYGSMGIRANCICPGSIETPMLDEYALFKDSTEELRRTARAKITAGIPAGRLGTPEEVAKMALFLASHEASFVNGGIFVIDGGATAGQVAPP
jgi:3-oxoacyl-[acyl-carrier protein] reductase